MAPVMVRPVWLILLVYGAGLGGLHADGQKVTLTNITATPQLTFSPAGKILSIGAFARITINIDMKKLTWACDMAESKLLKMKDMTTDGTYARDHFWNEPGLREIYHMQRFRLMTACSELRRWGKQDRFFVLSEPKAAAEETQKTKREVEEEMSDETWRTLMQFAVDNNSTEVDREERGVGMMIAGALLVGGGSALMASLTGMLFSGASPTWQEECGFGEVANNAVSNAKSIAHIAHRLDETYHLDHFQMIVNMLNDHAYRITAEIYHVQEALYDLQRGRVSPYFAAAEEIAAAVSRLETPIAAARMHLAVRAVGDVLLLPAFGVVDDGQLKIVIPIPVTTETLHMHSFSGSPLIFRGPKNRKILRTPQPLNSAIAVAGGSSNHILVRDNDLHSCFNVRDTYMCAELPRRLKRDESCLGALFAAHAKAIHAGCAFMEHPEPWHIAKAPKGVYILTTIISMPLTTTCHGQSYATSVTPGVYRIKVPAGCETQSPHFVISALRDSLATVELVKEVSWDPSMPEAFINSTIVSPWSTIAHDASVKAQEEEEAAHAIHPAVSHGIMSIVILILTGVLVFLLIRRFCCNLRLQGVSAVRTDPPEPPVEYSHGRRTVKL